MRAFSVNTILPLLLLVACAPGLPLEIAPAPEEIPALEARLEANPHDAGTITRLGAAYRVANRTDDARAVLVAGARAHPSDPGITFFLGLTYEDQGEYGKAVDLYERYVEIGTSEALRRSLEERVPLVRRRMMEASAREALARESELARTPPEPHTVAVFPFLVADASEELRPLGRALAEMMTTDLAQIERLTVLDRLQTQAMLREMALEETGLVDPATAARSGRLLRTERVVQGRVGGDAAALQLEAMVVGVEERRRITTLQETDAARQLLDMQKRLAFQLLGSMGIDLTPAERERVNQRPTENLQAILAYGRGLEAADAGDFHTAADHFTEAVNIDPGFTEAAQQAQQAGALGSVQQTAPQQLAEAYWGDGGGEAEEVDLSDLVELVGTGERDAASEIMGTEGLGGTSAVDVILRRP